MKAYDANHIRNIAIAGHTGKGKTSLAEAMLYLAKATDRLGKIADGNTVLDFDPEEKKRQCSLSTAFAPLEWKDCKINLLDAPGKFDFEGGVYEAMRAAECALIVTSAGSGFDVGAEKAIKAADARGIAKFFAITKVDAENRDFYKTFEALKEEIGAKLCPVVVPHMVGGKAESYVNLCSGKAFSYNNGKATAVAMPDDPHFDEMKEVLMEAVASVDDDLMMKYFDGEELTKDEIINGLTKGVETGEIYPVYACSGTTLDGVDLLLDAIVYSAPAPAQAGGETAKDDDGNDVEVKCVLQNRCRPVRGQDELCEGCFRQNHRRRARLCGPHRQQRAYG